ncbi:uncharacterized protein B0I36DRAFT_83320 [Microdochium trichocladiopsis]|uniref:Uncharacterized protein n=1 Tax=Microdochium trichocladiopsis TaxID=1682393 RepID=A0A9P8YAX9_9PEZI|nr:uncharacterized protein B0I36DRAFT_83320 [Microdochium trichocladiopsis]KAH7034704.1 hypothetical protein B0I36DRAFT_83320 [Microdochium trichocladiopsis]
MKRPSLYSDVMMAGQRQAVQSGKNDRGSAGHAARHATGQDTNASNNGRRRSSGVDGGDKYLTHTAILSAECQKRRFNPQFTEWSTNGQYYCSINLNGVVLNGNRAYSTANDAKQALAKLAVSEVKKQPCPSPAARAAAKAARAERIAHESAQIGNRSASSSQGQQRAKDSASAVHRGSTMENGPKGWLPAVQSSQAGQDGTINHNTCQTPAPASALSPDILSNPIASRAFLEGLALGARLYESAQRLKAENILIRPSLGMPAAEPASASGRGWNHERERSPMAEGSRRIRERSPLRNQHREP